MIYELFTIYVFKFCVWYGLKVCKPSRDIRIGLNSCWGYLHSLPCLVSYCNQKGSCCVSPRAKYEMICQCCSLLVLLVIWWWEDWWGGEGEGLKKYGIYNVQSQPQNRWVHHVYAIKLVLWYMCVPGPAFGARAEVNISYNPQCRRRNMAAAAAAFCI